MSAIHLDNRLAHYEVVGRRGQPIIFLHSWLGSWRYWLPTMDHVSERYRAYALDFWGFGDSDRRPSEYSLDEYVDMLFGFIDTLGLTKVNLVGHGMGGMVAIRAAARRPEQFLKLLAVTTPIQGGRINSAQKTNALERLLGRSGTSNVWSRLVPKLDINDRQIQQEIVEDTESLSEELVIRVNDTVISADLSDDLQRLQSPLLALFGERDAIVGTEQGSLLLEDHTILQQVIRLPKANHFPFLEQSNVFNRLLVDFLASDSSDPVKIKTEWRRRVSQREYM